MDRQADLRLQDADDPITRHRGAALTEMDADARRQSAAAHEQTGGVAFDPLLLWSGLQPPLHGGEQGLRHRRRRQSAATQAFEHIIVAGDRQGLQNRLQRHLGQGLVYSGQGLLQGDPAQFDELLAFRSPDVAADGRTGPARDRQAAPVGGHFAFGPADDLDHVAVLKRRPHRLQFAVDLDPHGRVPDLGVDRIGEVQRHAAARQGHQPPLGREDEHLVQVHFELGVLDPIFAALAVLDHLNEMAQVLQRIASAALGHGLAVESIGLVLVAPMGRHAVFRHAIHRLCADLHLDPEAARPDHSGVKRAIVVRLGRRDEILEPLRHHRPFAMDDAQGAIAVVLGFHDHAETIDVGQGRETDRLALQLAPNRIGGLLPPEHMGAHARLGQNPLDLAGHAFDGAAMLQLQRLQPPFDGRLRRRIQIGEGQFFQLGRNRVDADRPSQRGIDFQRLAADPFALLRLDVLEGAHVVQTVRQLDQQHPDVPADGQDEFPQVLRLAGVLRLQLQPAQLGHAFDQDRDLFAEHLGDVVTRRRGVLDHIVQQGCDDGGCVELVVGQYARDLDRVGEIGIARGPHLRAVHLHRIDIGAVQQRFVGGRVIGLDGLDQLELTKNRRTLDGGGRFCSR